MMRLAVLCLVVTLAKSHTLADKDTSFRDLYDEWTHQGANEIETNMEVEDYYDMVQHLRIPLPEKAPVEQPPESSTATYDTDTSSASEDLSTVVGEEEGSGNESLVEYTEDSDGYLVFPGIGRFKLHDEHWPWPAARRRCVHEGGDLAVPDSQDKVAVFMKMYDMHPEIPASAILRDQAYVGIEDPEDTREFVTVKGKPVSTRLELWATGEPDNQHPGLEDCVSFRTDARIRDVPCHFSLPFFCEKPL